MARKGILISDPSVRAMTDAQWLFEFHAAKERENELMNHAVTLFEQGQKLAARMLGLDIVKPAGQTEPMIVPLALLCGNPEMLQHVFQMAEAEAAAEDALNDSAYEAFVTKLQAQSEGAIGDMIPIPDTAPAHLNEDYLAQLEALTRPRHG